MLIKQWFNKLINDTIERLPMNKIKDDMNYFSRENDSAIPTRKTKIIERAKYENGRIPVILIEYLYCKGFNNADIGDINSLPPEEELMAYMCEKVAKENK